MHIARAGCVRSPRGAGRGEPAGLEGTRGGVPATAALSKNTDSQNLRNPLLQFSATAIASRVPAFFRFRPGVAVPCLVAVLNHFAFSAPALGASGRRCQWRHGFAEQAAEMVTQGLPWSSCRATLWIEQRTPQVVTTACPTVDALLREVVAGERRRQRSVVRAHT